MTRTRQATLNASTNALRKFTIEVRHGGTVGENNADEAVLLSILILEGRMERVPDCSEVTETEDYLDVRQLLHSASPTAPCCTVVPQHTFWRIAERLFCWITEHNVAPTNTFGSCEAKEPAFQGNRVVPKGPFLRQRFECLFGAEHSNSLVPVFDVTLHCQLQ